MRVSPEELQVLCRERHVMCPSQDDLDSLESIDIPSVGTYFPETQELFEPEESEE